MFGELVSAEFCGKTARDLQVVVDAFTAAFPSLECLDAADLLRFMYSEEEERQAGQRIAEALNIASVDGRWPGEVYRSMKQHAGQKPKCTELVLCPWVGDRVLRIIDARGAPIWAKWIAVADYSARPSATAAQNVIELTKMVAFPGQRVLATEDGISCVCLYNPPKWDEVHETYVELGNLTWEVENV